MSIAFPCGGKGICGGCVVFLGEKAPLPTAADRKHLSPEKLREGWRLACRLPEKLLKELNAGNPQKAPVSVLSSGADLSGITFPMPEDILAIDLGTTTIAMTGYSHHDGRALTNWTGLNPQRAFGADVLSRLAAAEEGAAGELKRLVEEALLTGIRECLGHMDNACTYIAGNTAMLHLLWGYPTETLGKAPFRPYSVSSGILKSGEYELHFPPCFSVFVGADIFADLYGIPIKNDKRFLLIDLGTNGEIVYGNGNHFTCTATAAGPAFEGGVSAGVFGADLVGFLAKLLREGSMDHTGLLRDPYFEEGTLLKTEAAEVLLTQKDIRQLQQAKAAIAAGIGLLTEGQEPPEKVYLAGGFGYYLNPEDAAVIGLIPEEYVPLCVSPGNAVLPGLLHYAADAGAREKELLQKAEVINLAEQVGFEERYIENLNFPG